MKRLLISVTAVMLALVMLFSACKKDDGGDVPDVSGTTEEGVTYVIKPSLIAEQFAEKLDGEYDIFDETELYAGEAIQKYCRAVHKKNGTEITFYEFGDGSQSYNYYYEMLAGVLTGEPDANEDDEKVTVDYNYFEYTGGEFSYILSCVDNVFIFGIAPANEADSMKKTVTELGYVF